MYLRMKYCFPLFWAIPAHLRFKNGKFWRVTLSFNITYKPHWANNFSIAPNTNWTLEMRPTKITFMLGSTEEGRHWHLGWSTGAEYNNVFAEFKVNCCGCGLAQSAVGSSCTKNPGWPQGKCYAFHVVIPGTDCVDWDVTGRKELCSMFSSIQFLTKSRQT